MTTAVDAVLGCLGVVAIVFPIAALADAVLGSPLGARVWLVAGAAGVLAAVAFAAREPSLGRLAKFVGVAFGSSFGWLVAVAAVMSLMGVAIPAGDREPFLYAGLLALATAYVGVYSDAVDVDYESGSASSFGTS